MENTKPRRSPPSPPVSCLCLSAPAGGLRHSRSPLPQYPPVVLTTELPTMLLHPLHHLIGLHAARRPNECAHHEPFRRHQPAVVHLSEPGLRSIEGPNFRTLQATLSVLRRFFFFSYLRLARSLYRRGRACSCSWRGIFSYAFRRLHRQSKRIRPR